MASPDAFRRKLVSALAVLLFVLSASASPVFAQNCKDFADRQIQLADRLMAQGKYAEAIRVLNVAVDDCDIASVREKIASAVDQWSRHVQRRGSASMLSEFIQLVSSSQSNVPSSKRGRVDRQLVGNATRLLRATVEREDYSRAHRYCRAYSRYTDRTFEQNYYCATASENAKEYTDAVASYEWLLNNWEDDQSFIQWDETATTLNVLYLRTTRFDRSFELSKRLTIRTGTPQPLLMALLAMRGRLLEPIVRTGRVLFDGVTADRELRHVREEMARVKFPEYVESVYLMTGAQTMDAAFYGADLAQMPRAEQIETTDGSASLVQSNANGIRRAWLVAPVDAGHFVVQFTQETVSEENVLLEGIIENVQDDAKWQTLRDHQNESTNAAAGSAVATVLGASYLGTSTPLRAYNDVFDTLSVLRYYCVQNDTGEIVSSHQFQRGALGYSDEVWRQSSKTPALYHHELTLQDTPVYEVVWPTYDGDQWTGVIRIGITNKYE